jgi:TolB protein
MTKILKVRSGSWVWILALAVSGMGSVAAQEAAPPTADPSPASTSTPPGGSPASTAPSSGYVAVGQAKSRSTTIGIGLPVTPSTSPIGPGAARQFRETVENDLMFIQVFTTRPPALVPGFTNPDEIAPEKINVSRFSGLDWVMKSRMTVEGDVLVLEAYLYNVAEKRQALGKRYRALSRDVKTLAHTAANDIVRAIMGVPGIFLSKIAMTCDARYGRDVKRELFTMNFDGTNLRQVTQHRSQVISPAWSHDGTKLAYSVYIRHSDGTRNLDILELDTISGSIRRLVDRPGTNIGISYHPRGGTAVLTASFQGSPSLYQIDLASRNLTPMTDRRGEDVDSSFSADGSQIAFASSRSGGLMVFAMPNSPGGTIRRLTYAGNFNSTPSWSPRGDRIAFSGEDRNRRNRFDVFTMNVNGPAKIENLTQGIGSSEEPVYSPDGNLILFTSNRSGSKKVYIMPSDPGIKREARALSLGVSNCTSPAWSQGS